MGTTSLKVIGSRASSAPNWSIHPSNSGFQQAVGAHARQCATMPVVAGGRMVGLLTLENISEMIMVNAAMKNEHAARG